MIEMKEFEVFFANDFGGKPLLLSMVLLIVFTLAIIPQNAYAQADRKYIKQKIRNELVIARKAANRRPNGHYLSLGTSLMSSGYYGELAGVGYEYRHYIVAPNVSVGVGTFRLTDHLYYLNACAGIKLYFADKATFLRNLYVNILPFCYFGQAEDYLTHYTPRNNAIVEINEYQYPHLYGSGIFFGYSPAWHIGKKVSLGFNIDVGVKSTYKFEFNRKRFPIHWDFGLRLKFDKAPRCNQ